MPEVKVRNTKNQELRSLDLPEAAFGAPMREHLVYEAVQHHRAALRAGTHSTKTRGDVAGSGKKLWNQKKTGRARMGSIRSPIWRKGGIVHGPHPRDYDFAFPRQMRRGALRSVLSERLREGRLVAIEALTLAAPRTKDFVAVLKALKVAGQPVLVVDERGNENLALAARNVPGVLVLHSYEVEAYDVLAHAYVVITEAALQSLGQRLSS
jgi:large subunit ribosomal protein L4